MSDHANALFLLVNASRINPTLRQAVAVVEARIHALEAEAAAAVTEKDAVVKSAVDVLLGGCAKHGDLSFPEFVEQGGGACGVCLTVEVERLRARIPDPNDLRTVLEGVDPFWRQVRKHNDAFERLCATLEGEKP